MKLALVTGGTQRLGAAIAARLAASGYALALHYRSEGELDRELSAAIRREGVAAREFSADFGEEGAPAQLIDRVRGEFGHAPTLLVNSASMFGSDDFETTGLAALTEHFRVNAAAPILLAQSFASALGGTAGAVVNILDQRLVQPHGDNFAYTVAKFALAGATEMLSRILAPGIRVNAVAPGLTLPTGDYDGAQLEKVRKAMPLDRLPSPEEIADAAAYLADASSVTGQTIYVDGGARHRYFPRDFDRL
ncbi:short-chain dehydrogenase [Pacificimonas flava]|uniref:Short-chain dehydrogenase n=1 Tax=Pacificimonas flava TaxID=1234595 RepID=A0A219B862_9SPHN|nr:MULTISPECIES: SDR family oxidoreductase [Pacificimonas]OWV34451.1 short-chain dehydrogenase [Pacificimonas flava]